MAALCVATLAVTGACTTTVPESADPSVPTAPTTTFTTTTSTTEPPAPLTLQLDNVEALAVDRGVSLEVRDEDGEVLGRLDIDNPLLEISPPRRLSFRYLAADDEPTNTVWEQRPQRPVTTVRQPWRGDRRCQARLPDGTTAPVALAWQAVGDTAIYLEQLDGADGQVTVVSPIWWRFGADGSISSSVDAAYVDAVHERNVAIWPAVAGFNPDTHHLVLSDSERRTALAVQISEEAKAVGADGINIDLEGYRDRDADAFLSWVEELAGLVRDWGGVISYDLVPRSDHWEVTPDNLAYWSTAPLRTELSAVTDCTVLMAYDQHNRYRPAGPVAAPGWVEEVLVYSLRHTDPAQLVLGIPFYARIWDPADLENPEVVGIGALDQLASDGETAPDPLHGVDRVELADGRLSWAETVAGLEHRLSLVDDYGLAGWAAWRFGFDDPAIWELVGADRQ